MLERLEDVSLTIPLHLYAFSRSSSSQVCHVDCMPPSMQIGLGRNKLILLIFSDGYSYKSIVEFLYQLFTTFHCQLVRHLKRILARFGLRRHVPILSHGRFNRIVKHIKVSILKGHEFLLHACKC